jgi:hypothetical protein
VTGFDRDGTPDLMAVDTARASSTSTGPARGLGPAVRVADGMTGVAVR